MKKIDHLQVEIFALEETVQLQQKRYEEATRSLGRAKAALAVDEIVATVKKSHLTTIELQRNYTTIFDAVDVVTAELSKLETLRTKLQEAKDELLILDERNRA